MTHEEIMDEWLNYGERDINPLYGMDNESITFFYKILLTTKQEEIAKKEEELDQKAWDDELAVTHYFKKAGEFLYLIGEDWPSYEVVFTLKFLIVIISKI